MGGIRIVYDPSQEPGSRLVSVTMAKTGEALQKDKVYALATKPYLVKGGDGYVAFKKHQEVLVEDGVSLLVLLRNYFIEMQVIDMLKKPDRVASIVANAFTQQGDTQTSLPERILPAPECDGRIQTLEEAGKGLQ